MDTGLFRLILLIIAISIPIIVIEILINKFSKRRIYKYILPIISLVLSIILIIYSKNSKLEGFASLANVILGIILIGVFILTFVTAIILELRRKKSVNNKFE